MPGPLALRHRAGGWVVECRLCDLTSERLPEQDAEDLAHDHVVAAHPEVEEP